MIFEFLAVNPVYEISPQERSLDEIHQMYVPTRTAYLGDIFMDGVGASMGLLFAIIVYTSLSGKFFSKRSKNKFSWFK